MKNKIKKIKEAIKELKTEIIISDSIEETKLIRERIKGLEDALTIIEES